MGYDRKYGKVTTEFGSIEENEPVIVFRARDMTLPNVILAAIKEAAAIDAPIRHIDILQKTRAYIIHWQHVNLNKVRVPASESSKERLEI